MADLHFETKPYKSCERISHREKNLLSLFSWEEIVRKSKVHDKVVSRWCTNKIKNIKISRHNASITIQETLLILELKS